ncbi:AAA family ATPase [Eubacterium xylanophilum]|uniref:AAA family ATPase n=1 Tax=Eubacterium xylanophilum TaxID=39497 RepID=UPI00047A2A46|nr:AAA family ATPase [Eubacterium xylanophilum]
MKIRSIKLHNFMRYKGDNELMFSTDDEKNVTVVLGDNTFGKTTLAQAFRWGLYENLNDTNYGKKKDIVLLNNEVAASMNKSVMEKVFVEIVVINEEQEIKFVRTANYIRKNSDSSDISVKQIGNVDLTMQVKDSNGVWGDVIPNCGKTVQVEIDGKKHTKKYSNGCVQDAIDNMFPQSLSNYFFFDGERWNDLKSKTNDIKDSIYTILGVSGLIEMMNHLRDGRISVEKNFRGNLKGVSGEYSRLEREIKSLNDDIAEYEEKIEKADESIETEERIISSTQKTLNDNRKIEDDQKEYRNLESDINRFEKVKNENYAEMVKILSKSAQFFAASLLEDYEELLSRVDLEGRDIPGVTVDTIDYLIEHQECLCGTRIEPDSKEYDHMIRLRKQVPPEMLGGAAGKLKENLLNWRSITSDYIEEIEKKAELFDMAQDTIDEKEADKARLEKTMDRKTNLGPVREQNKQASIRLNTLRNNKVNMELKKKNAIESKESKEKQLDALAIHDKRNAQVYRCLEYLDALYKNASIRVNKRKNDTLNDLNDIIEENFQRMFNDHEKYAKLGEDYKVHVYYKELNGIEDCEELYLSNGETIAINFVFIVSILELANKYREAEKEDEDYGMENAILGLPLVLDGPFSALSGENTSLISSRLPQFAEQVIIFMLDKDWEPSGLDQFTLPEYCYRVCKDETSNSSSLEHE